MNRIVVLVPCLLTGGTEVATLESALALKSLGYLVEVIVYFDEVDGTMLQSFQGAGVRVHLLGVQRDFGWAGRLQLAVRLAWHLARGRYRVVWVQYMTPTLLPLVLARLRARTSPARAEALGAMVESLVEVSAEVVAVDLDPRAVAAARENGIRDARQGDLFAPVQGERFDWICFNPPFFAGTGRGRPYRRALYGGPDLEVVRRFSAEVGAHLSPRGVGMLAWSERAPPAAPLLGHGWSLAATERVEGETLELWISRAT